MPHHTARQKRCNAILKSYKLYIKRTVLQRLRSVGASEFEDIDATPMDLSDLALHLPTSLFSLELALNNDLLSSKNTTVNPEEPATDEDDSESDLSSLSDVDSEEFNTDSHSEDGDGEEEVGQDRDPFEDMDGWDIDVETDDEGEEDFSLSRGVSRAIEEIYAKRYQNPRDSGAHVSPQLPDILSHIKDNRPDHFHQELRVSPSTFDALVQRLEDDPVFSNSSNQDQMLVEHQVAITLHRFGHFGNAAGLDKVAKWSGYAKGTILLATRRVMTAILRPSFVTEVVRQPTTQEKEEAKKWVESRLCREWRDGWCMVDGTLVPLYFRPSWYGESYFDRKCNYSLNIQVINLPNRRIIDFSYGFTGSTHDATAWEKTWTYQNCRMIFLGCEFIWGDSAYPIEYWLIAPFKSPESEQTNNDVFNNHVSMIRIRSEHAIGFLKGQFQSLKGLQINIVSEATHKVATLWVAACIAVHSFAMLEEKLEREANSSDNDEDPFIREGLSDSDSEAYPRTTSNSPTVSNTTQPQAGSTSRAVALGVAKTRRLELRDCLITALERHRRRFELSSDDSNSDSGSSSDLG